MDAMLRFSVTEVGFASIAEQADWDFYECPAPKETPDGVECFNVLVSEASDFEEQIRETEAFIEKHRNVLERLGQSGGAGMELDFGRESADIEFVANHRFPLSLLALLVELGIGLDVSVYAAEPPEYLKKLAQELHDSETEEPQA